VAGAIAVWIIGRWLIALVLRLLSAALTKQEVDPTLQRYIANIVGVALNIVLVVAILGYFGVETTSFAALIAAMGIAIGAAWAGLLTAHYWQVYFDTKKAISDTFGAAGFPVPEAHVRMRQVA
jgi:small-conductance mechanosensitive channel